MDGIFDIVTETVSVSVINVLIHYIIGKKYNTEYFQ